MYATLSIYRENSVVKRGHKLKKKHKSFGQWLKEKFTMGKPTDEELEEIMEEDLHADFESPFDDPNNTESGSTSAQLDGSGTIISDSPRHWANQ